MIFGSYLIAMATVAVVLSAIGYFFIARGNQAYTVASKWSYYLATGLVIVASAYLISLFLNDRFEFSYVSGYSSIDLASNYKVTSFWAGQ
jgi:cytochrome c biogenesis factor